MCGLARRIVSRGGVLEPADPGTRPHGSTPPEVRLRGGRGRGRIPRQGSCQEERNMLYVCVVVLLLTSVKTNKNFKETSDVSG